MIPTPLDVSLLGTAGDLESAFLSIDFDLSLPNYIYPIPVCAGAGDLDFDVVLGSAFLGAGDSLRALGILMRPPVVVLAFAAGYFT